MTPLGRAPGTASFAARGVERCVGSSLAKAFPAVGTKTEQRSPFSSESNDDDHHFGVWQPNQTTVVFQRMEETCPDAMKLYARCVIDKQNSGALIQGACGEHFQAVMDCFRSVR